MTTKKKKQPPNRTGILVGAVIVISLAGVASVAYIALRLASTTDKVFFVGVITAFLAPTLTALLAILRGELVVRAVNGIQDDVDQYVKRPSATRSRKSDKGG
jgi:hypothetical protein